MPETSRPSVLAHGTTVATNALLERRLGRVALVATRGFADVLEIARQARPSLYDARVDRPAPLVPRELRFEVSGRLDASGGVVEEFDGLVPHARRRRRSRGVSAPRRSRCVPTSARWPTSLRARGIDVVCSHEVSPEFREYERMVTTVADAALRAVCSRYARAAGRRSPTRCW